MSSKQKAFYNGPFSGKRFDPLNKKIPENPLYSHVRPVVDSGANINRYLRHLETINQNYRFRKDEIFKRLKVTTFAQLILQVENYERKEEEEGATPEPRSHSPLGLDAPPLDTPRSTLSSVISGMGELDIQEQNAYVPPPPPPPGPAPYLLLDVRDKDDYKQAHIITAKHYSPAMLARTMNCFSKEILEYKNKSGMIIILYDEDERTVPQVATTFVQRGIDNLFMLSGGMRMVHKHFPDCMITGQVPLSYNPSPPNSSRSSSAGRKLPLSSSRSLHGPIQQVASADLQDKFKEYDLDKVQTHLDTALLTCSVSASRLSSRSSSSAGTGYQSLVSSRASSRASSSVPWK